MQDALDGPEALNVQAEAPVRSRANGSEGACSRLTGPGASCSGVLA